jgi:hypothetical protein
LHPEIYESDEREKEYVTLDDELKDLAKNKKGGKVKKIFSMYVNEH